MVSTPVIVLVMVIAAVLLYILFLARPSVEGRQLNNTPLVYNPNTQGFTLPDNRVVTCSEQGGTYLITKGQRSLLDEAAWRELGQPEPMQLDCAQLNAMPLTAGRLPSLERKYVSCQDELFQIVNGYKSRVSQELWLANGQPSVLEVDCRILNNLPEQAMRLKRPPKSTKLFKQGGLVKQADVKLGERSLRILSCSNGESALLVQSRPYSDPEPFDLSLSKSGSVEQQELRVEIKGDKYRIYENGLERTYGRLH